MQLPMGQTVLLVMMMMMMMLFVVVDATGGD